MSSRTGTIIKAATDLPARLYGGNAQEVQIAKQTAVPVTIAAVHAAPVNLGLIT